MNILSRLSVSAFSLCLAIAPAAMAQEKIDPNAIVPGPQQSMRTLAGDGLKKATTTVAAPTSGPSPSKSFIYQGNRVILQAHPDIITPKKPNLERMSRLDKVLYDPDNYVERLNFSKTQDFIDQSLSVVATDLFESLENEIGPKLRGRQCSNTPGHTVAQFIRMNSEGNPYDIELALMFSSIQTCAQNGFYNSPPRVDTMKIAFQTYRDFRALTRPDRIRQMQKLDRLQAQQSR
jgi:hypothetical protein